MTMFTKFNPLFLCNFDGLNFEIDNAAVKELWLGNWTVKNVDLCKEILSTDLKNDQLIPALRKYSNDEAKCDEILHIAIGSFLTFCDQNWNPAPNDFNLDEYFGLEWPSNINAAVELQYDSEEVYVNIVYPELLLFSSQIINALYSIEPNLLPLWWLFRCKVTHQRILDDSSATLYSELNLLIAKLCNESYNLEQRLRILLHGELCQASLLYDRVQEAEEHLSKALSLAGLKLELTGVLGKRTKFQQDLVPQLALSTDLEAEDRPSASDSHGTTQLPVQVALQDDVRLSQVQYNEKVAQADLPSLEQTLCLVNALYLKKAQPKDDLLHEELLPYIEIILSQKNGPWATRVAALLLRCQLESKNKRTIERAMMQCEEIATNKTIDTPMNRLSYLWASGVQPTWRWRQQLADLYCSLGLVKAALEIYLSLQLWEDVILCYTLMQLRHKAAEIIEQQLAVKPTVKLYCYLGDATDTVSCYKKAWELSQHKSSRAQRHWGSYLFNIKRYEECIPHYEKSLEINSLQESVWLRLGYAALVTEQWEKSANAYRRYTYLQPSSFEAWNNLAKVYVQQGHKDRAYRTLMEALKYNYDNWKLWENVITVSVDVGQFDDVVRGCHRVLDLQKKYLDVEVLCILARESLRTAQGNDDSDAVPKYSLKKSVLELFGRITSIHRNIPEIWCLYADISPYPAKMDRLMQAYKSYSQAGSWPDNPETCKMVIQLAQKIVKAASDGIENQEMPECTVDQVTSSVRLMGRAVIRAAHNRNWPENQAILEELQQQFDTFMEITSKKV